MQLQLLRDFENGDYLTDEKLIQLETQLTYYADYLLNNTTFFSEQLDKGELHLLSKGARYSLNHVQDMIKARGISR